MSALRLGEVEEALLCGRSHGWVQDHFAQKWKLTERQLRDYIARVEALWKERAPTATPELREKARERVLMLMRTALESKDSPGALSAATKAADMLNKIDGVYTAVKVEHSGTLDVSTMTPAQRRARIAELEAKARAVPNGG